MRWGSLALHASGVGVRLTWALKQGAHHYEVWADGRFAGVTSGPAWYLPKAARTIQVVAVSEHQTRSVPAIAVVR